MKTIIALTRNEFCSLVFSCTLLFMVSFPMKAQWVTIPDTAFVSWLTTYYPQCMNGNQMDTTCQQVENSVFIDCKSSGISDLTGIEYFDRLTHLRCMDNSLSALPPLPQSLTELLCNTNQLTSLPPLPPGLIDLHCNENQLTSLPPLPQNLTELLCWKNQITSLPLLPPGLIELFCYENQLTSLPSLPQSLTTLFCWNNLISSLPALPQSLTGLHCQQNQLTSLPPLPQGLVTLNCGYNELTTLPLLPQSITSLDCSSTELTSLPPLPQNLISLICGYNYFTSLPPLPQSLTVLFCPSVYLTSLPALPQSLVYLNCNGSNLTSLPELPDSLNSLSIGYNPNLTCLPRLKRIVNFQFISTGITCLPNYGNVTYSTPSVDSLPLCVPYITTATAANCGNCDGAVSINLVTGTPPSTINWSTGATTSFVQSLCPGTYDVTVTDSSVCTGFGSVTVNDSCGAIQGQVFNDLNSNGIKDAGEMGVSGITVQSISGGLSAVTNQKGDYAINVPAFDTFRVEVFSPSSYHCSGTFLLNDSVTAPVGNLHTAVITQTSSISTGHDFGLKRPVVPCGTISGYVFNDLNGNGIDDGEPRKNAVNIVMNNNQQAISNEYGMYSIEVPLNFPVNFTTVPTPHAYYCDATQTPYFDQTYPPFHGSYNETLTTGSPTAGGKDFGVKSSNYFDVGVYNVSPNAGRTAGKPFTVWIDFKASGSNTDTCCLRLKFNPLATFVSATVTPTAITSNYIEWCYPPGTAPAFFCMTVNFILSPAAQAGTVLVWRASYTCSSADGCSRNNTLERAAMVDSGPLRRAQDNGLNLMEVFHTGNAQGEISTADSVFSYVINFQNTSTDTTYHLTIVDTLSPHLNIETISYPFSNLPFKMNMPGNNIVIWEFNKPLIPDSTTDYLNSYGFIQYNIHMKPNLAQGTVIENRATIISNYINAYQTNTTSVIINQLLSSSANVTDVTCFEGNDGAIDLVVNGGTAPYDFIWSNGATTEDLLNVGAGNYSVTIEDADSVTTTYAATIAEGFDVNAGSITGADSVNIGQNSSFNVAQVSGYTYSWGVTNGSIVSGQGTSSIEVDFDIPGQGTITLMVSAQGCSETVSKNVVLSEPTGVRNLLLNNIALYPNPTNGTVTLTVADSKGDAIVRIYDALGQKLVEQTFVASDLQQGVVIDLKEFNNHVFFLHVSSEGGSGVMKVLKY